jgi:uncharacterized membrane protein
LHFLPGYLAIDYAACLLASQAKEPFWSVQAVTASWAKEPFWSVQTVTGKLSKLNLASTTMD